MIFVRPPTRRRLVRVHRFDYPPPYDYPAPGKLPAHIYSDVSIPLREGVFE